VSISSPEDSLAKTSPRPDEGPGSRVIGRASGSRWLVPFAYFDPDSSSSRTSPDSQPRWVSVQGSLLSEPSSPTWPRCFTWDADFAYQLPTSEAATSESESSFLLPTPMADDDRKTPEQHLEMKRNLPGGARYMITSLAVLAKAGFRQPNLLPTPNASHRGDRSRASLERGGGRELRAIRNLLPTPTTQDAANTAGPSQHERNSEPLNVVAAKLLPTPTATDSESSGSRNLEGSRAHAGVSLTDAILYGNSTTRRDGDPMPSPSSDGPDSLDGALPNQLTIEDA
jgi:hypothetical protein